MSEKSYKLNEMMGNMSGSKLKKYQMLVVGKTDIFTLCAYEFICMFVAPMPGAMGMMLRKIFYPMIFGNVGSGVVFGRNITIRHPHKIRVGDNVVIDDNCMLDAKGEDNKGITIGADCFIGRNTILSCKNGDIILDEDVNIGFNCEVFSSNTVHIKRDTLLAAYCYIIGGGMYETSLGQQPMCERYIINKDHKIEIGPDCWLGAGVRVLDNVLIGSGTVVGAGALVTKNVEKNSIAVGVPAKVVKERE